MRGSMHIEDLPSGKQQIIITEIPYNVNRATLVTRIADLVRDKILDGVSDLRMSQQKKPELLLNSKWVRLKELQ